MVERDDTELSHSAAYKVEGGSRGGQAGSIWAVVVVVRVTEVREGKKSGMKEWRRKSRLGEASGGKNTRWHVRSRVTAQRTVCEYKDISSHVFPCVRSARRPLIWPQMLQTTAEMKDLLASQISRGNSRLWWLHGARTAVTDGPRFTFVVSVSGPAIPASH